MAYRIIIIDDEKEISGGFAMFFPWKMLGYTVAGQFETPPAALDFLWKNEVDVVCLDVKMPGMDGLAMAEEIRSMPLLEEACAFHSLEVSVYGQRSGQPGA